MPHYLFLWEFFADPAHPTPTTHPKLECSEWANPCSEQAWILTQTQRLQWAFQQGPEIFNPELILTSIQTGF